MKKLNNKEIGVTKFVDEIYESIIVFIPKLKNVDVEDVRQEICSNILSNKDLYFGDAEQLVHYIRATAGNVNVSEFNRLKNNEEFNEVNLHTNDDGGMEESIIRKVSSKTNFDIPLPPKVEKTVKQMLEEKGDYRINELASFLGVHRSRINKMIKSNELPYQYISMLNNIKKYDKITIIADLKDILKAHFGSLKSEVFANLPVSRTHLFGSKNADVNYGISYTKTIEIIEALEKLNLSIEVKFKLQELKRRIENKVYT
ncbi:MAG: helix-turn-helix domain-containing protein [Burkholderiales bacterium]|nr:helix-turn-helix domain-containing protein [Burkholderiales bacterium]